LRERGKGAREQGKARKRELPPSLLRHELLRGFVDADDAISPEGLRSFR